LFKKEENNKGTISIIPSGNRILSDIAIREVNKIKNQKIISPTEIKQQNL